jgi:hypothetical protein
MKPYGRQKHITGGNSWKIDSHLHSKGKKVENWWENIESPLSRSVMKQNFKKIIHEML